MRLSYLDILLSTATIFVVLFGVSQRSGTLPEVEGKALAMIVSLPRTELIERVVVEVEYRQENHVFLPPFRFDADEEKESKKSSADGTMECWIRSDRNDLEIRIAGQPHPKTKFIFRLEGRLNAPREKYTELIDVLKAAAAIPVPDWDPWTKEGIRLAASSAGASEVQAWAQDCKHPGGTARLLESLRKMATFRDKPAINAATMLAAALMVHDSFFDPKVDSKSRLIPTTVENPEKYRDMKFAFYRAGRRLVTEWGKDCPMLRGYPKWCPPLDENTFFRDLPKEPTVNKLTLWSDNIAYGPSFCRDYVDSVLKFARVYSVHAGKSKIEPIPWKWQKSQSNELRAEVFIPFEQEPER